MCNYWRWRGMTKETNPCLVCFCIGTLDRWKPSLTIQVHFFLSWTAVCRGSHLDLKVASKDNKWFRNAALKQDRIVIETRATLNVAAMIGAIGQHTQCSPCRGPFSLCLSLFLYCCAVIYNLINYENYSVVGLHNFKPLYQQASCCHSYEV